MKLKLVTKYIFSAMSLTTVYIKMISGHRKCANPRWLPKWLPNAIYGYNSMADRVVQLLA